MNDQHGGREHVVSGGMARGPDGRVYLPAEDTTNILRAYARTWMKGGESGGLWKSPDGEMVQLDPATLKAMATELIRLADKMDVDFIAERPPLS